jgi:putative membrane protein
MSTTVPPDDPRRVRPGDSRQRDHLANRRTFLAGIRTAITLYAFGFTIAKFAMYLDQERPRGFPSFSEAVGTGWIVAGVLFAIYSFVGYKAVQRDIEAGLVQARGRLDLLWVAVLSVVGLAMSFHLFQAWTVR